MFLAISTSLAISTPVRAKPRTRVHLNGRPTPVEFNDGDSFAVKAGPFRGTRARLAGFNTLESHGPVHRWGSWHPRELYNLAKLATRFASRGVWSCVSESLERDTYGRILWYCKDLAVAQIRRGYAHAMTVDHKPAAPELLAAQRDAIRNRRGMWAHGVPGYVLTSLHSTTEADRGKTYNRLVSTADGHSAKWTHDNAYSECEWVCREERPVSTAEISAAVTRLETDAAFVGHPAAKAVSKGLLQRIVADFAQVGVLSAAPASLRPLLQRKLEALRRAGILANAPARSGSCALYVEFKARYGSLRARCL